MRQLSELLTAMNRPGYRTIFGGDLNLTPPAAAPRAAAPVDAMGPAYDAYEECDQSAYGGRRTGTPTYGNSKIDYIFGPPAATYRCRVAPPNELSDHRPIYATVTLPAS
jgi:endonuclease/exonuclease/phosphatase family metal-dependent hydrolase